MTLNEPQVLPPDTQAILLLCASFGQNRQTEQPLTLKEYNTLASWLLEQNLTPADLLNPTFNSRISQITIAKLDSKRLTALLERGVMLSLAVEKWTNQGLWIIGRGEKSYPKDLKQKLKHLAPPILYGVGNKELLSIGGLAIIGSRDVDEEGLNYTQKISQICAQQDIQVISGGARGVDQTSMLCALEAGGTAIGVLADSLSKASVNGKYRTFIKEDKLTLISAYDPDTRFHVGNAMGRNKYIYALADYALIISSSFNKGGTWAGAVEALEQFKNISVFVRMQGTILEGNLKLFDKGAKAFPKEPWEYSLKELLKDNVTQIQEAETALSLPNLELQQELRKSAINNIVNQAELVSLSPRNVYEAVLPIILRYLEEPKNVKTLAEYLDVRAVQIQDWLNRAVAEGKIQKNRNPVTYQINRQEVLLSLLESKK